MVIRMRCTCIASSALRPAKSIVWKYRCEQFVMEILGNATGSITQGLREGVNDNYPIDIS